jgi:acyl carrier protein
MTRAPAELDAIVRAALADIAPEIDADNVAVNDNIRDSFDLDSIDFLGFVEALHAATGIDIPERDYRTVETVAACVAYLGRRMADGASG